MRFAERGLYVERYVKCANCGVLIYEDDHSEPGDREGEEYCSPWCREWARERGERTRTTG